VTVKRQRDGFGAFRKETECHPSSSRPTSSTATDTLKHNPKSAVTNSLLIFIGNVSMMFLNYVFLFKHFSQFSFSSLHTRFGFMKPSTELPFYDTVLHANCIHRLPYYTKPTYVKASV
jgi:hypothetical protein